jgi:hypothetical protein
MNDSLSSHTILLLYTSTISVSTMTIQAHVLLSALRSGEARYVILYSANKRAKYSRL